MRRSSEPGERAQFSVAELLARYGEPPSTTGRRRRRAPDDDDTAVQSIVERVRSDTGPLPVQKSRGRHGSPESGLNGFGGGGWAGANGASSTHNTSTQDTSAWTGLPALVAEHQPVTTTELSDGPATEQFPRLDPMPLYPPPLSPLPLESVAVNPVTVKPGPWRGRFPGGGEAPAGLANGTRVVPDQKVDGGQAGETTGQAQDGADQDGAEEASREPVGEQPDAAEAQSQGYGSPVREWAVMVTQVGIGVIGGAALWLICEWLWLRIPVVALVVALAVITGLVWVVRRVRCAEDLQTTVIAVLVGLFVTVSPAALLLVGR